MEKALIRFPEFEDTWTTLTLGDCFIERNERAVGNEELLSVTQSNGVIRQSDSDKRNISSEDKSNYKIVKKGDIAYNTMRMWQGAEGLSEYDGIVSPAYTIVTPQKGYGAYFEQLFKTIPMMHLFQRFSQGLTSDTWNLKYEQFSKLKVTIPSEPEQEKIVDFLTCLDSKIKNQTSIVEDLELKKKSICQKLFKKEIRLKDNDGNSFPDWATITFGDIITTLSDKTADKEQYPLYSLTIEEGVVPKTERYEREFLITKEGESYKVVPPLAFVYNPMNLRFGALKVNHSGLSVSVSGYYDVFYMGTEKTIGFWENYLLSYNMIKHYNIIATGSLIEKKRVHFSQFKEIKMQVPSEPEQERISEFLSVFDQKIAAEKSILEDYKTLKQAALQQMFA